MVLLDCVNDSYSVLYYSPKLIAKGLIGLLLAITFIQSGFDKVSDRKGNLKWLNEHFSKTFMKSIIPFLLSVITLLELSAGTLSIAGFITVLLKKCDYWVFWGSLTSATSLLCLFFGQRIAKDYAGAQSLVVYFIVALLGLVL